MLLQPNVSGMQGDRCTLHNVTHVSMLPGISNCMAPHLCNYEGHIQRTIGGESGGKVSWSLFVTF